MKNDNSDLWNIVALLKKVILGSFITIILIVAGFLIYLSRTHKYKQEVVSTTGVYNLVNSENGEIIATDLTGDDLKRIMEYLDNGEH